MIQRVFYRMLTLIANGYKNNNGYNHILIVAIVKYRHCYLLSIESLLLYFIVRQLEIITNYFIPFWRIKWQESAAWEKSQF